MSMKLKKSAVAGITLLLCAGLTGNVWADRLHDEAIDLAQAQNEKAVADRKARSNKVPNDVSAGHWSYEAVKKLTEEGLVEGVTDGLFEGDRPLTRYEMAVIIARAAKKEQTANDSQKIIIEALKDEYNKELTSICGQIAELNKKIDRWQIHGYMGARYDYVKGTAKTDPVMKKATQLSFDIQYHFNDHIMLTSNHTFNRSFKSVQDDFTNLGTLQWVDYTNKSTRLRFGRWGQNMGYGLLYYDGKMQGMRAQQRFGKLDATFIYGKYAPPTSIEASTDDALENTLSSTDIHAALMNKKVLAAELDYSFDQKTNMKFVYQTKPDTTNFIPSDEASLPANIQALGGARNQISKASHFGELGFDRKIGHKTTLTVDWVHSNAASQNDGFKAELLFGNPWPPLKGHEGFTVAWYYLPSPANILGSSGSMIGDYIDMLGEGYRGPVIGYQCSPINNTLFDVFYMYGETVTESRPWPGGYVKPGTTKKIFRADFAFLF